MMPTEEIVTASKAQLERLEQLGRLVRGELSFAALAGLAWDLHATLYSLQCDGVRGADAVDLNEIENLASLLERLRDEQATAAA